MFALFSRKTAYCLLASCVFLGIVLFSSSVGAIAPQVQQFIDTLTPQMERHLQQSLQRREVFFDVTPQPNGNRIELQPYARLDRDTVFDVALTYDRDFPVLTGKVFTAAERNTIERVAHESFPTGVRSQLAIFPYDDIDRDYAITTAPYSNLYTRPDPKIENLATQVRLGTAVKLLEYSRDRRFARVRIEDDGYLAWIDRAELRECDRAEFDRWVGAPKAFVARDLDSLYFGTRLPYQNGDRGAVTLTTPDGQPLRVAYADLVLDDTPIAPAHLLELAKQFLPDRPYGGGSYLWGGTVGKRLDCSGFVQTVLRAGNLYIPRDAYQQQLYSTPVAPTLDRLDELQAGDLVFFSNNGRLATHVGIYLGNGEFIHSTHRGPYSGVKINSLRGSTAYDRSFQSIYFGGGRVPRVAIGNRT
ncbi:C40 family peptidase [Oxynema sp. CENA135]|uniref:C40 family peptidase n=1 Tax=Oxynema sp. CENA135 TaxID=984206 RepID=UPI00190A274A|nr:C40 family peptidase [Oxynema sp. CENA135]MBK4729703.1 C40 family peptidase [Oxynema sp. CENA135]